ncbi:hypothetical protein [Tautonia sociabilis]|uniref:Quinol:cytochrome C oxidoreductase n=1 Tax=Tautonia sociabilis TaxID=2080755 RepID=A0A432MQ27_9BACT|nr:hypothetical protein [Tautonia sociabilis]RUL89574.1 hypothetical protein TsocGM_02040 [Tautonia sociabilis]
MSRFFGPNGNGNGDGLSGRLERIFRLSGLVGLVGLGLCLVGVLFDVQQVLRSYLMAYLFWLGPAIAGTMLLLLIHLAAGTWGVITRRPLEAAASTLVLMVPLYLPIAIGLGQIYPWAGAEHGSEAHAERDDGEAVAEHSAEPEDEIGGVQPEYTLDPEGAAVAATDDGHAAGFNHKEIWFNRAFFFGRAVGYFAIFGLLALAMTRWSAEQDRAENPWLPTRRLAAISGPGLLLAFLTATFLLFDWGMSLDPEWYSTLYGAMLIIGMGLQTFALTNIVVTLLTDAGTFEGLVTPKRLRDLGNLMLAFVMLWAYTTYSQFLIIWSGDLSEEIPWYLERSAHGWQYVAAFLVIFHFFLPFLVLLFRANKENTSRLRTISAVILGVHVVDVYWLLAPSLGYDSPVPHLFDLPALIGVGGLWVAAYCFFLNARPILAKNEPKLVELLASDRAHASHSRT